MEKWKWQQRHVLSIRKIGTMSKESEWSLQCMELWRPESNCGKWCVHCQIAWDLYMCICCCLCLLFLLLFLFLFLLLLLSLLLLSLLSLLLLVVVAVVVVHMVPKIVSGYLSQCGKPNSKPPIFSGQYQLIPGFWRCPLHRAMWSAQHVTLAMRLALFRSWNRKCSVPS